MLNNIILVLLILAGIEIGLVAAFSFSLLGFAFGSIFPAIVLTTIGIIIGVAAIYKAIEWGYTSMQ